MALRRRRSRLTCWPVIVVHSAEISREHDTSGKPCWCNPTIKRVLTRLRWRTR